MPDNVGAPQTTAPAAMLRASDAAAFLGLASSTLAKWRVYGQGPRYRKLGRAVVYDPADLRAWIDAQARHSTSASAA